MSHATLIRDWQDAQKQGQLNKTGNWFKNFIKTEVSSTQDGQPADDSFELGEQEITSNNLPAFSYTAPLSAPLPPPQLTRRAEGKTSKQSGSAHSSPTQQVVAVDLSQEDGASSNDDTGDEELSPVKKASSQPETQTKPPKKRRKVTTYTTSSSTLLTQMNDGNAGTEQPGSRLLFVLCWHMYTTPHLTQKNF